MPKLILEQREVRNLPQYPGQPAISEGEFVVSVHEDGKTFAESGISGPIYSIVSKKLCGNCRSKNACRLTEGASGGGMTRFHFQVTPWDEDDHISTNEMRCQATSIFNT